MKDNGQTTNHIVAIKPSWLVHETVVHTLEGKGIGNDLYKILTCPPTINSARTSFILQPPPIRNEIVSPVILKSGEVRVPCGSSPCSCPAVADSEGRSSAPPIHQFPC